MSKKEKVRTRQVDCDACPLRAREAFRSFSDDDLDFIKEFKTGEQTVEAGGLILSEGVASPHLFTVLSGWGFRYKLLEDGRRQILNFALPGDFLGVQGAMFDAMDHSVEALDDMLLCVFSRERLGELFREHPEVAFDVTWLAAREERILDDFLITVGRRTAREKVAFMMLHLCERAEAAGLCDDGKFACPITQNQMADALGISHVHANRTIRSLSQAGLISWKDKTFHLKDRDALLEITGEEPEEAHPRPLI